MRTTEEGRQAERQEEGRADRLARHERHDAIARWYALAPDEVQPASVETFRRALASLHLQPEVEEVLLGQPADAFWTLPGGVVVFADPDAPDQRPAQLDQLAYSRELGLHRRRR